MKSYDLKPTTDNLISTYQQDVIGRNSDIFLFTEILNEIEDGCAIALDGRWGSGKTFFVKQVKMVMDAHNNFIAYKKDSNRDSIVSLRKKYYGRKNFDLQPQVCVYYDAWENDNDDDPIMSLVYAILNSVDSDFDFASRNFIDIGASIMELFSGMNWPTLIENLKKTSPLDTLKGSKDVESLVGEFLESLIPEKGNRLVVFIDELDRCKPSYAVRLLERIKHYFTNEMITFVFSVNINELQHTIKKYYGDSFNGSKYLDRFFDLRISLPPPNLDKYYQNLCFQNGRYTFDVVCDAVIKAYHFELREIAKYLRIVKIAAHKPTHGGFDFAFPNGRAMQFCLNHIVPIMIGLKIHDMKQYTAFIEGKDCSPLIEILGNIKWIHFDILLNENETFDQNSVNKTYVTLTEKLNAVYEAVFVTSYTGTCYSTSIGDMEFDHRTKEVLIRTAGLLSQFTNLMD